MITKVLIILLIIFLPRIFVNIGRVLKRAGNVYGEEDEVFPTLKPMEKEDGVREYFPEPEVIRPEPEAIRPELEAIRPEPEAIRPERPEVPKDRPKVRPEKKTETEKEKKKKGKIDLKKLIVYSEIMNPKYKE